MLPYMRKYLCPVNQSTEYKSVKRNSKAGDQVTIDFKGMLNGEVFEGGVASDFKMVLGKGSMNVTVYEKVSLSCESILVIAGREAGVTFASANASTKVSLTISLTASELAYRIGFANNENFTRKIINNLIDRYLTKKKTIDIRLLSDVLVANRTLIG
jgi:hypothetical protein